MKNCPKCKTVKPASDFNKSSSTKSGLRTQCKSCCAAYNKEYENVPSRKAKKQAWGSAYRAANVDRYWEHHLKRKYGITRVGYYKMLDEQGGVCAMCRKPETVKLKGKVKRLNVDHCHETGAIRGLLCLTCNVCAKPDDIAFLELRIAYLKSHQPRPLAFTSTQTTWMRN